jgi:16S rRNA (cytosine967-C5)-methyltransferase
MQGKLGNPRWLALTALIQVVTKGKSLDTAADSVLVDLANLDQRNLSLYLELLRGSCRWFLALRLILKSYLRKPFKTKDSDLESVLIIGLYQILLMRVDNYAAVNETVNLVRLLNKPWARGLVNGVLRQVIRDQIVLGADQVAATYPDWMQLMIARDWPQQSESVLEAGNNRAPLTLRVDTTRLDIESAIASLREQGEAAAPHELVESTLLLDKPCDVTRLDDFVAGLISVQDAAAQLAAGLLNCQPGMRVLDACAAPGGKTVHILQSGDNLELVALDKNATRLKMVEQNLLRTQSQAQLVCGDAANPEDWHQGSDFDRILADVPCSGSGVIRRHPDIRLLRRESDVSDLVAQQRSILKALWPLLKPGGLLIYSTCSIFKVENEQQIEWFLETHDNCREKSLDSVQWGVERPWGRQILPGQDNMDGFFYARLQKAPADGTTC